MTHLSHLASEATLTNKLRQIEQKLDGRLGFAAVNIGNGRETGYRADERFPLCSTFKILLVATVLARVDRGMEKLSRCIPYGRGDLLPNSPYCQAQLNKAGVTVSGLCRAAIVESDNAASNLLLAAMGGPAVITRMAQSLGDTATRLDRYEPELNEALSGDPRDTTTPNAMVGLLRHILLSEMLSAKSRRLILVWMKECATGQRRIRSGVPENWQLGHKTGTGHNGATGDVGIVFPPGQQPILLAVYVRDCPAQLQVREEAIAAAAKMAMVSVIDGRIPPHSASAGQVETLPVARIDVR